MAGDELDEIGLTTRAGFLEQMWSTCLKHCVYDRQIWSMMPWTAATSGSPAVVSSGLLRSLLSVVSQISGARAKKSLYIVRAGKRSRRFPVQGGSS